MEDEYTYEKHLRVMALLDEAEKLLHQMEEIVEDMSLKLESYQLQNDLANKQLLNMDELVNVVKETPITRGQVRALRSSLEEEGIHPIRKEFLDRVYSI